MAQDIYSNNSYSHISANATYQICTGRCILLGITVNSTAAGTITIYDETANSGTESIVAILAASVNNGYYPYNIELQQGLKVTTAAASDITVIYRII